MKFHKYQGLVTDVPFFVETRGDIGVTMPGGTLSVGVSDAFDLSMLGPVRRIAEGVVSEEFLHDVG